MTDVVAERSGLWPAGPDEAKWGIPAAVICLLGAQAFAIIWFVMAAGALYGSETMPEAAEQPIWNLLVFNAGLWIAYLAAPILLARITGSGLVMPDFDLGLNLKQGAVATVIGVGTQLAILPVLYWVVLAIFDGDPNESAQALGDRVNNVGDGLLFTLAVVGFAPLVEEWFYRGMLLPTLARRFGMVGGAVGSAVVFALVHQQPILLPGLFVLALLLAWLTAWSGRIGPAVVAHMAFNATTVIQLLVL